MSHRLAILGHPVGHALSPVFHTAAFAACGIAGTYETEDIAPGQLSDAWGDRLRKEYTGLNVTVPHKVAMMGLADSVTDEARSVGAVNTLVRRGDSWTGHNTDVEGIVQTLRPHADRISGQHALVVGAGGAARAVLGALAETFRPSSVTIYNRHAERAVELAALWSGRGPGISVISDRAALSRSLEESSLVVQATSVGMHPFTNSNPLEGVSGIHEGQIVFDLIYRPRETRLMSVARSHGATVIGGLEMFLHQAVASFTLWTGTTPPLGTIRPIIEKELLQS